MNTTIIESSNQSATDMILHLKDSLTKQLNELKESQQFLSDLVDDLRKQNHRIIKENEQLKNHIIRFERESDEFKTTNQDLEGEINKIQQGKLINNIVITNMPRTADYVGDFWKLVSKMDAKLEKADISSIELNENNAQFQSLTSIKTTTIQSIG